MLTGRIGYIPPPAAAALCLMRCASCGLEYLAALYGEGLAGDDRFACPACHQASADVAQGVPLGADDLDVATAQTGYAIYRELRACWHRQAGSA